MTPDEMFWWNWWVQFFAAVGTVGAVVYALFGDAIKYYVFPPKLKISLKSRTSEETDATFEGPRERAPYQNAMTPSALGVPTYVVTKSRWYHIAVENERRWAEAREVQVFLLSASSNTTPPDVSCHAGRGTFP